MMKARKESEWINVYDDEAMRNAGLMRPFNQSPRDKTVWTKTPNERRILKYIKKSCKKGRNWHIYNIPHKRSVVRAKLIIYLKSNKTFPKSTYSIECGDSQVSEILGKFREYNKKTKTMDSIVLKYTYNRQPYGA